MCRTVIAGKCLVEEINEQSLGKLALQREQEGVAENGVEVQTFNF